MAGIASASVDGQAVAPEIMGFLQQRKPFPGGHTYSLRLEHPVGQRLPKDLRNLHGVASAADASRVLHAVEFELARMGYHTTVYAYFPELVARPPLVAAI